MKFQGVFVKEPDTFDYVTRNRDRYVSTKNDATLITSIILNSILIFMPTDKWSSYSSSEKLLLQCIGTVAASYTGKTL